MKPNQTHTLDWSRARRLLNDLKSATRRSLSAQVLLGGELAQIKKRLGSGHGANKVGPLGQFGPTEEPWDAHCQKELGFPKRTANRYIQIFESARNRALARKNAAKRGGRDDLATWERVCVLMDSPSAELTGGELEELAVHVHELVDHDTQAGLLEELGIKKAPEKKSGGDTSAYRNEKEWHPLEVQAEILFTSVTRRLGEVEAQIFKVKSHADYRLLLDELSLVGPEDGPPNLTAIEETLEELINGKLAGLLNEVRAAKERKMHGTPPKRERRKSTKTVGK